MRTALPVFVVSALLFICSIGLVVVTARGERSARAAPVADTPRAAPVATTQQIMKAMVAPASTAIFQAVQTNVTLAGTEEIVPRSDDEWALLGAQAASLAEAGNLLTVDGRAIDRGDWLKMSQAMVDAARQTMAAVDRKAPEDVLASGEAVNTSCDNCHERYRRQ